MASCPGRLAWVLVRRRNSPVDPLERIRRTQRLPLQLGKAQKGEEIIAGLVKALHDGWTAKAPLLRESGARQFHGSPALGVDHPAIVLGEFLAQTDRRLGLKVSQLVCLMPMSA